MPSSVAPNLPPGTYDGSGEGGRGLASMLPRDDTDPVRSPEDPSPADSGAQGDDSSSSLKNIDSLLPPPDSAEPDKRKRHGAKEKEVEETHQETAKSDIEVGSYYLDQKNWKAALSRFESAMVLDPENPEVYWGMAEAERNLGQFARAREHYEKLLEYDPDGKHGKQVRKVLKDPALAAAFIPGPGKAPIAPQ
jgi:tetratricopeptide (TPR) repeat protein